jgi:hypothetical protein
MNGRIELTPDELTKLVGAVFAANGLTGIQGLAIESDAGELVGYAKAVIHYDSDFTELKVYPKPDDGEEFARLQRMLNANATTAQLATVGQGSGASAN